MFNEIVYILYHDVAVKRNSRPWWSKAWALQTGCLHINYETYDIVSFSVPQFPCLQNGSNITHLTTL